MFDQFNVWFSTQTLPVRAGVVAGAIFVLFLVLKVVF